MLPGGIHAFCWNTFWRKNREIKLNSAAITGVKNQPLAMPLTVRHLMPLPPLRIPIPITAPTMARELETGTSGMDASPWLIKNRSSP